MSVTQARVITLKSTVSKIVQAILLGNSHIGASDVGPLVDFCSMVGTAIPPSLKPDPSRPAQYLVGPVAKLVELVGPNVGIPFTMADIPAAAEEEAGVISALKAIASKSNPEQEAPVAAEAPVRDDRPDLDSMSEAQLLLICKTLKIVRNQNGTRVSKAMSMGEFKELIGMAHDKTLPDSSYASSQEELEPKTRVQPPPSRVGLMNMTQLREALDELGVKHTTAMNKPALVALVEAQHADAAASEEAEADLVGIVEDED